MIRSFIFGVLMCSVYAAGAQSLHSNAHIGFIYPLSTNGTQAAEYSNKFSMHALGGLSKNEEAVALYGVAGVVRDTALGYMASGVVSIVGKAVDGCQMGGCVNYAGGNVHGFQAAGFINVAGSVDGAQAGGFANVALTRVNGLQAAGFINTADTAQVQLGGFVNVASHSGVQVAGFVNKANDVDGSQIAGFINVGRKVKGVQIAGFINIADSCDYPIGLINITRNGEQALGVTVNEIGTTMATFRSGGRVLYGIIGIGGNGTGGYRAYALQGGYRCTLSCITFVPVQCRGIRHFAFRQVVQYGYTVGHPYYACIKVRTH